MAERDRVWQQLRELGGVEEAVRWCEQMAKAQPANADAQTDLGVAFVNLMLQATTEEQRIELGKRIEAQFDKALALQPDHWEARFRRAVGLSYGDQMSGRRTEAITEFERLVTQQAALTPRPGHAETYVYLGRLYAQRGEHDKAREIWRLTWQ
jgi:tetratricopeptide (TPR) repeat protein